eukprot:Skav214008  [mRNA]  locus=scaffold1070:336930:338818:- [translate_table: standard]
MSGYPEDLNIIVCKDFDDFATWVASAPHESLSQALEMTKAKVHEWIKKQLELERALKRSPGMAETQGSQQSPAENSENPRRSPKEQRDPQREWEVGDRASIAWEEEGLHIFWPGTITSKENFVRVKVMDETGLVEMQDCSTTDYISPQCQHVQTERHGINSSLFVHSVQFKTQTATHIITNTFSMTNGEEKLAIGRILEWKFDGRVPGLPYWFSFELDGDGGRMSKLEGTQFHECKTSHIAPEPTKWPETGVLLEQVGASSDSSLSRIGFENCHDKSGGIAIFVKVCAFEDRNEVSWGFWWQQVPDCFKKKWTSQLRLVFRAQRSASRDLWQLLCGHWTDMSTVFEAASLLNFVRALRYWQNRGLSLLRGPWSRRVEQILQSAGFWQTQLHVWRHVEFGTASWIGDDGLAQANSVLHFLREQWRKERFSAFLHHKRREAEEALAAGVSYDDVDVKRLRLLYDDLTAEQQGVLLGASWSIAAFDKLHRRAGKDDPVQVAVCPFCQQNVVPNWLHIAWHCPHFATGRPPEPELILAKRLGWPIAHETKQASMLRIDFLSEVRAQSRKKAGFYDPGAHAPTQ